MFDSSYIGVYTDSSMPRPKKAFKPTYIKLASDAAELLEEYCRVNRFDATFAIENMIRLHVPMILERKKAMAKKPS